MHFFKLIGFAALIAVPAMAQFTYTGCSNLASSDFKVTSLVDRDGSSGAAFTDATLSEPVQMDFQPVMVGDSVASVNVYFVERLGKVKFYDATAKTITTVATISTWAKTGGGQNDNGLMGIALDPNFKTNRWMYLWYTPPMANANMNRRPRLSRFTVNAANTALTNEKVLFDILGSKTDQWHCGGPMQFDSYGDLWGTMGNNSNDVDGNGSQLSTTDSNHSAEWGSSNTHSLRGGVWRIHPDDSDPRGYTIPAGNFGDYFAQQIPASASQYRDTSKVLPEVYVKGTRSNFSISVHPTKRWLSWGEVNYNSSDDEFDLTTHPIFSGFPYFHANNQVVPRGSFAAQDPNAPVNNSPLNSGLKNLPPATPAVIWYGGSVSATTLPTNVAIGGPIYSFNPSLKSSTKFPPHLNNTWVLMSFQANSMYIVQIDSTTVKPTGTPTRVDNGLIKAPVRNPINAKYGPDGSLYVLDYDASVYTNSGNQELAKVDYVGSCHVAVVPVTQQPKPASDFNITMGFNSLSVGAPGEHTFGLYNLSGGRVYEHLGRQGESYSFSELRNGMHLKSGVYTVRVKTARGVFTRNVSML